MKAKNTFSLILLSLLIAACVADPELKDENDDPSSSEPLALPAEVINLNGLSGFESTGSNWQIAGNVFSDLSQKKHMESSPGEGILVNLPSEEARENIFSKFEHGDIELEFDVLIPKGSNSGVYLQGRYEVQVFDSWGVENPKHADLGGIYQRWDESQPKGKKGYEGVAPLANAAKAPGLWQHFKILFHAPKFDQSGQKIKNAWFEEVWLNGMLIHQNVELSGPTRGPAFAEEAAKGPLLIQGDHGPVAYKNIQYKLFNGDEVKVGTMSMKEFESREPALPDFSSLTPKRTISTDTFSYNMGSTRDKFCLVYEGNLEAPIAGEYLLSTRVHWAGVTLVIGADTLFNLDASTQFDKSHHAKTNLEKGANPFTLIFNRPNRGWAKGFLLEIEGPGIQKHALHAPSSAFTGEKPQPIVLEAKEEPVLQRGFMMYQGEKLTHTIAVSTPQNINYAYNLASGSLIQVWGGDFLDVTDMWHERGNAQLGKPLRPIIEFTGQPDFAVLKDAASPWPSETDIDADFRQLGYELDEEGLPSFMSEYKGISITNKLTPTDGERKLKREILVKGEENLWLRIDQGGNIVKLPNGYYAINDYHYYLVPDKDLSDKFQIREGKNGSELIVHFDKDTRNLSYDIVW